MFSLIITIISIALVAALALATLYYGGAAFSSGGDKALSARLKNEGAQVKAAAELYSTSTGGSVATSLAQLSPDYLSSPPAGWSVINGAVSVESPSQTVCETYNAAYGINTIPTCGDAAYSSAAVCCSVTQ